MVARVRRGQRLGMTVNWHDVSLYSDGNVLKLDVMMTVPLYKYTKVHCPIHLKQVDFTVCKIISVEYIYKYSEILNYRINALKLKIY